MRALVSATSQFRNNSSDENLVHLLRQLDVSSVERWTLDSIVYKKQEFFMLLCGEDLKRLCIVVISTLLIGPQLKDRRLFLPLPFVLVCLIICLSEQELPK